MLNIRQTKHLCRALRTPIERLVEVTESAESFYEELLLQDPTKPNKTRLVVNVRGRLRALQSRLYRSVLLPKLRPSPYSHGGVHGRSIKTNLTPHIGSVYALKLDISNFYPSIHHKRVYRLFLNDFKCSPDVARLCTRLCTYRHHLALGLITSPFLADQIMRTVDRRIGSLCQKLGLVYTRFVDDLAISGPFDLEESGVPARVEKILGEHGFSANKKKTACGRIEDRFPITNLCIRNGHPDVRKEYVDELNRQLADAQSLVNGGDFTGPYYTSGQVYGRIQFVSWVNLGRRAQLIRRFRSIPWAIVEAEARTRGFVASKKVLKPVVSSLE